MVNGCVDEYSMIDLNMASESETSGSFRRKFGALSTLFLIYYMGWTITLVSLILFGICAFGAKLCGREASPRYIEENWNCTEASEFVALYKKLN